MNLRGKLDNYVTKKLDNYITNRPDTPSEKLLKSMLTTFKDADFELLTDYGSKYKMGFVNAIRHGDNVFIVQDNSLNLMLINRNLEYTYGAEKYNPLPHDFVGLTTVDRSFPLLKDTLAWCAKNKG